MGIANSLNLSENMRFCAKQSMIFVFFNVSKVWFGFGQWSGRASVSTKVAKVLANAAPHLCRSRLKSAPWCDTTNAASFAKHAMIIYHHDPGQPVQMANSICHLDT